MRAEIIASGTELLLGEVSDINTSFIASELANLGIDLYHASIVGDNLERFTEVLEQAYSRSDIVIITGGLGPTKGDITREVIARVMAETMELDLSLQRHITEYFARMKMEMSDNNLKQAMLIPSATPIINPLGTAPGWWVEKEGKIIVSLPGPPGEMQPMWYDQIFPRLEKKTGSIILSRTLKTWGLSEARIDELVRPYMLMSNPTLALYAKQDGIHLRITAKCSDKQAALDIINGRESELRQILGNSIWGTDQETLEKIVGRLIMDKNLWLSVSESFTGGLVSCIFSGVSGSERFFRGGIIVGDLNTRNLMGIVDKSEPDPISSRTAMRMAELARERFNSDIGMGIDGYTTSTNEDRKSGKAFLSISIKGEQQDFGQTFTARPNLLARRTVINALFFLRRLLINL